MSDGAHFAALRGGLPRFQGSRAMLSAFDLIAILIVLTAIFGWLNHVFIGLPHAIGLLVMGLISSLILIGVEIALPNISLYDDLRSLLRQIDFQEAVLNGMLAFLLFAGALHVNLGVLKSRAWAVSLMATVGVVISTGVVGVGFWWLSALFGAPVLSPGRWSLAP